MTDFVCRLAVASLLAVAGGLPLVAPTGRPRLADLAAAWTLALGNAAVLALAAGLAGWTLAPWALALLLIAPGLAAALGTKARAALAEPANSGNVADVVLRTKSTDAAEGAETAPVASLSPAASIAAEREARKVAPGGREGCEECKGGPPRRADGGEWGWRGWGNWEGAAIVVGALGTSTASKAWAHLTRLGGPAFLAGRGRSPWRARHGGRPGLVRLGWLDGMVRLVRLVRRGGLSGLPGLGWLPGLALAVAAVLAAAKLAAVPLWSWDHFAVWGVKARTMMPAGHLRLGFLGSLYQSRVDHPLGLPMAWLILTLGKAPDPMMFKALHAVFAAVLAVLLQAAVARITSSQEIGCAAAAALVISPLFWDSEAVGLAELPLALWAVMALYLLIRAPVSPIRLPWAPGLALGFLPWIKQEGLPLALLALAFCCLAIAMPTSRRTAEPPAESKAERAARLARGPALPLARWLALAAPAVLLLAGAWAVQRWALPPGASFFAGAWCRRGIARLPELGSILRHCATDLLQPDWLGFWALLAAATFCAALRRRMRALALAAVVWCQVVVYMLTALFSYIAPHDHLNAAFFRICAPLMPLGLMAIAMTLVPPTPAEAGPASEGLL